MAEVYAPHGVERPLGLWQTEALPKGLSDLDLGFRVCTGV